MRRSTTKAAVAIVALSVAIPALAQTAAPQYVIGADGSVQYAPAGATPAPLAEMIAPTADQMVTEEVFTAPVPAPAPVAEPVPMEVLSDASATNEYTLPAPAPVETYPVPAPVETYAAPAPVETYVAPTPVETYVAPAPVETYTAPAPVETYAAPAPAPAEPAYVESYSAPAPVAPVTTYVAPEPAYVAPPAPAYVEPVMAEPSYSAPPQPDYATLVDPAPIATLDSLPMHAPSGLSIASRGDGAYGRSTIDRGGESAAAQSTDIFISKSAILNLPADAAEVSVSDPTQVRAVLRTARQIMLIGLKVGQTNIIVFDSDNNQILSLDVNVRYDLRPLRTALKRNFPNTLVDVETVLGEVILTGSASGPGEATEIRQLVRRYLYSAMLGAGAEANADSIEFVDRLATASDDQVMLKVRVAEMRRSVIKQFGVDWSLATSAALVGSGIGGPFAGADLVNSINSFGVNGAALGGLSSNIAGSIGNTDFGALVRAFERHNVMRTLAEPTLTAVTGETASFLAGGQFPYPVSVDENGNIGYDFRDFGVALEFTPVVVGEGRISLRIATEVSELTNEGSLSTSVITIPGISVRRANTTVEIPSGGTMSIAGMLLQRDTAGHAGLPGLKNVPVVGQLFSSSDYLKEETELVILVTPYVVKPGQERDFRLPTDGFAPASDIDFFLLGRLHKVYGTGDQDLAAARQALKAPLGFIIE